MDRKRQKVSLVKNEAEVPCQEEEIAILRQKLLTVEAELKLTNTQKEDLRKLVKTLEQELAEKEDLRKKVKILEQELAEKEDLRKRIRTLEQELAEKEDLRKRIKNLEQELAEKEDLRNRVITLEHELTEKENQLKYFMRRDINYFPDEAIVEVFKHLPQNELGQIARVCSRWNDLIKSPVLWQKVNVEFHWSHISQNDILKSFINKLPTSVTSIKVKFVEREKWIQPLNFREICATLQERCPRLQKLFLYESMLSNTHPSIIYLCSQYLPDVTTMVLNYSKFLDSIARVQCDSISKIEILDISGSDVKQFSKLVFSKMPNLKQLYLSYNYNIDNWFDGNVSFLNQLEILEYTPIGSTAFQAIKNHGLKLKELYMCWTLINDNDLKFDSSLFPLLKTVCLNDCNNVTCEGVVSLVQSCPSLQNIYVHELIARSYAKHPFNIANTCKLGIVKTIYCHEHIKKYY